MGGVFLSKALYAASMAAAQYMTAAPAHVRGPLLRPLIAIDSGWAADYESVNERLLGGLEHRHGDCV